jgi:excinuclease ABC subunit A
MGQDKIIVRGAREHNLKNIDVEIPRDKLVVITGLSGSGKSSLAFDTIFAEGQRRYVESLSAYARQFLGQLEKPDVDQIEGLSPAVSIDQKGVSRNPRSTVGTVTEIYDYLRLLYARIGTPHCPECGRAVEQQSAEQIVDAIMRFPQGTRIQVLAPVIRDRKGHHQNVLDEVRKAGFVRVRIDGQVRDIDQEIALERYKMHTIDVVVDRLVIQYDPDDESAEAVAARSRLTDSVETALKMGEGVMIVNDVAADPPRDTLFSEQLACIYCGISLPELEPRSFSFNSPHGACPNCEGLGVKLELDPELIVPNPKLTLGQGALDPWPSDRTSWTWQQLKAVSQHFGIPLDVPWEQLNSAQQRILLHGSGDERVLVRYVLREGNGHGEYLTSFEGVINNLRRRYRETNSDYMRRKIEGYMADRPCPLCGGSRLRPESLAVTIDGRSIVEVVDWPVVQSLAWVNRLVGSDGERSPLSERQQAIGRLILREIHNRLEFMVNVGLDYLTLSRSAGTLSGGEAQRIRLATQIGSQLMGVLYVLDEPSIGLHQRDQQRLLRTLEGMRDLGNTLLVVEHDEDTMRVADYIIDLGPGAGVKGGEVVCAGSLEEVMRCDNSLTGAYLSGRMRIPMPRGRRTGNGRALVLRGACEHNLKGIDVSFPLSKLICVTGVSGSGKSTLVVETLHKRLAQLLYGSKEMPGAHSGIEGVELIDGVINIDQSPIGRTPRSNPATYTKLFDHVRQLFAELPESKVRGYKPGRFSFNVKGGRCEACRGQGQLQIEMQFLPDIYVPCDVCHGSRYNRETLQIRYKGLTIAEVLELSVDEALDFFANFPAIRRKLLTLRDVGLGYIRLGQPATTLSGGEAQRIKLSRELSKRSTGQTLYILDEPSVGLHAHDVARLIQVLNRLVEKGNTVVIIEHHPDIIKVADHIIDLGPEGGDAGGEIVAEGTPEAITHVAQSYTGQYLSHYFQLNGIRSA